MMNESGPLVGIDVGSTMVKVVVGGVEDDRLVIRGCGQAGHDGARRGVISNLDEVASAVREASEEAEAMASVPVELAVVGLGGMPIQGLPSMASVPVTGRNRTVSDDDLRRALTACAQVSIPDDFRVLDIIACGYALDGQSGMQHPVGMPGTRLDASAFVVYTNKTHAETVEQSVNRASVAVKQLVYEPLAAAEAVVTPDERELGCLLLDLGYATTEWVLFNEGAVVAAGALPASGNHFTRDLAALLKTTTAAAEKTKRTIGASLERDGLDVDAVEVPSLGGDGNHVHPARFAAEILHERARDLFIGVHRTLVEHGLDRLPRAGVVLTGGAAALDGLEEVAEKIFGHRARIGRPLDLAGLIEPVSGPQWAVACGLIRMQCNSHNQQFKTQGAGGGFFARLRNALGDIFEMGGGHDRV
ncbi:MAG: cell division protein FtsA [Thermoanaerobaculales bacterium]|jgi:cell division protein FtsA|nr:cell division protein FtsA [Thermoanaerobaculales bacterium]